MNDNGDAEEVLHFSSAGERLWGILSRAPAGAAPPSTGVLIVVGGPQYRAGSHRAFVLLARHLARRGYPTLRFDNHGMGDSTGATCDFEAIGPDMDAAIDALLQACPGVERVVVWGLCDAASAALMFATAHPRVSGIVAANPWARSASSLAAATVRHYYLARLAQREFWGKLLRGGLHWRASVGALIGNVRAAGEPHRLGSGGDESFHTRMARGMARFRGAMLLILSGNDLTAQEFLQYTQAAPAWRGLLTMPTVSRFDLAEADHTFSQREWLDAAAGATVAWLERLAPLPARETA